MIKSSFYKRGVELRLSTKTEVPNRLFAELNPYGDYFINKFYSQFESDYYSIVGTFDSIVLINSILEEASNNSENSEFTKNMALYLGLAEYVNDFDVYYDTLQVKNGQINTIPILCHYEVTDQRIIDFVTEKRALLFNLFQSPDGKSRHLRRPELVSVSSLKIEDGRIGVEFDFSILVENDEDYFIEKLGQNCIRYTLKKDHHGSSRFTIKKSFYQEFK